jgi:hypothetical protein
MTAYSDWKDKYAVVAGLLIFTCISVIFTSTAFGNWYSQDPDYYRCIENAYIKGTMFEMISDIDGPATLIRSLNDVPMKFTTRDVKEGGKIVETTITIPYYGKSVTFYRTKERCEIVIAPLKKKAQQERLRREKEAAKYQ